MKFYWQKWINYALAIVKSNNEAVNTNSESNGKKINFLGPLELINKVDLSLPMLTWSPTEDDNDDVLIKLPGSLNVWTAWPVLDVRCCQFELDQWMHAAYGERRLDFINSSISDKRAVDEEYSSLKKQAVETLTEIATWDRSAKVGK